jgi:hypothetical protein
MVHKKGRRIIYSVTSDAEDENEKLAQPSELILSYYLLVTSSWQFLTTMLNLSWFY